MNAEELREFVKDHSGNLAKIGSELAQIQFNYKVIEKAKMDYWEKRVEDFSRYHQKGMEYYIEIHSLMNLVDKEKADFFLLNLSKLRQLGKKLQELFEQVKQNPSIISSKDKQQSKWSKEIRDQLIEYSNKTLEQEKFMNANFREFYDKNLKKMLE